MQSLSKAFSTLKLGTIRTLPLQSVRPIHTTTELSRRSRDYYGFRQEAGRAIPGYNLGLIFHQLDVIKRTKKIINQFRKTIIPRPWRRYASEILASQWC